MSLENKKKEIERLISAFESEANKFLDIRFSIYYVTQEGPIENWVFGKPNHNIMLWQYQGMLGVDTTPEKLQEDLEISDLQWGVRGAKLSLLDIWGQSKNFNDRSWPNPDNRFTRSQFNDVQHQAQTRLRDDAG